MEVELKGMSLKERKKVEELMAEECDQRCVEPVHRMWVDDGTHTHAMVLGQYT